MTRNAMKKTGRPIRDFTGMRFERLFVLERAGIKRKHSAWLCLCDCGKRIVVTSSCLPKQKSCGCLTAELARQRVWEMRRARKGIYSNPPLSSSEYAQRRIKNLTDSYVRAKCKRFEPNITVTPEMIAIKREQLQLFRLIRKGKELINEPANNRT